MSRGSAGHDHGTAPSDRDATPATGAVAVADHPSDTLAAALNRLHLEGAVFLRAEYREQWLLLQLAETESGARGWTPPRHSDERTPEGAAWTARLGAEPALTEQEQADKLGKQISGQLDTQP
jgi:hypothetical protein